MKIALVRLRLQLRHHGAEPLLALDIFACRLLKYIGSGPVFEARFFFNGFLKVCVKAHGEGNGAHGKSPKFDAILCSAHRISAPVSTALAVSLPSAPGHLRPPVIIRLRPVFPRHALRLGAEAAPDRDLADDIAAHEICLLIAAVEKAHPSAAPDREMAAFAFDARRGGAGGD